MVSFSILPWTNRMKPGGTWYPLAWDFPPTWQPYGHVVKTRRSPSFGIHLAVYHTCLVMKIVMTIGTVVGLPVYQKLWVRWPFVSPQKSHPPRNTPEGSNTNPLGVQRSCFLFRRRGTTFIKNNYLLIDNQNGPWSYHLLSMIHH